MCKKDRSGTPEEGFGTDTGFLRSQAGPLPRVAVLPPFTDRDLVGFVGDVFLNPINWLVLPIIEVEGVPSASTTRIV